MKLMTLIVHIFILNWSSFAQVSTNPGPGGGEEYIDNLKKREVVCRKRLLAAESIIKSREPKSFGESLRSMLKFLYKTPNKAPEKSSCDCDIDSEKGIYFDKQYLMDTDDVKCDDVLTDKELKLIRKSRTL